MKDELLYRVRRPVQYVDAEVNAVHKDGEGLTRFALAFPDTYELGMSHLGLKILYHALNTRTDAVAERVFAPEDDMEELLRERGELLATLESRTPLAACHVVGFTLQSELHYTTILNMLELGGIPVLAADRGESHPMVVGGGPQAMNPEPLADFFDAFVLGDGEEVVGDLASAHAAWRARGAPRKDLLLALAALPGVYVPSLYRVEYSGDGRVEGVLPLVPEAPPVVRRRLVADLDRTPFPLAAPVPYLETTHDRLTVEVARGCMRGCRFCHAGMVYRPYRERSPGKVLEIVEAALPLTGYDEVSLAALSTGDYCHLAPLARTLAAALKPRRVSLSLPSIRPGSLPAEVIREVGAVRKSGFTIAPEAGTERLRRVINKGITEEEILSTAASIFAGGWKSIKLYFMIGLPGETAEDVEGIYLLARRIKQAGQAAGVRHPQVTVSVSPFVPKAHTPFQWCAMASPGYLASAVEGLHRRARQGGIGFKWHHPEMSVVEGLLSRGDRRLSRVILRVWRQGGKFEAWTDRFDLERWRRAMSEENLETAFYTERPRGEDEVLPWDHLSSNVSREYLLGEYRRGLEGVETPPCNIGRCLACGACAGETPAGREAPPEAAPPPAQGEDRRFRVRLRFDKKGRLRWLSHLELFRAFYRACRRAGLPLSYTCGFNPHPRISFGPPLSVGAQGEGEMVDLELASPFPQDRLVRDLNAALPPGLRITGARYLARTVPSVFEGVQAAHVLIELPPEQTERRAVIESRISGLLASAELPVERESGGKRRVKNVRPFILEASVQEGEGPGLVLEFLLGFTQEGSIRPAELLELIFPGEGLWPLPMRRTGLYRLEDGRPVDAFGAPGPPRGR